MGRIAFGEHRKSVIACEGVEADSCFVHCTQVTIDSVYLELELDVHAGGYLSGSRHSDLVVQGGSSVATVAREER